MRIYVYGFIYMYIYIHIIHIYLFISRYLYICICTNSCIVYAYICTIYASYFIKYMHEAWSIGWSFGQCFRQILFFFNMPVSLKWHICCCPSKYGWRSVPIPQQAWLSGTWDTECQPILKLALKQDQTWVIHNAEWQPCMTVQLVLTFNMADCAHGSSSLY